MADSVFSAGGGGGAVILRAEGSPETTVIAKLGEKVKTGVIDENGVLQLKLPGLGLWNVKTENGDYSYEQDVEVYRYGITPVQAIVKKPFNELSFAEINLLIKIKKYRDLLNIGDKMAPITVGDEPIEFQIVAFDTDEDVDGNKVPITLISADCLVNWSYNERDWSNSTFRTTKCREIKSQMPKEFAKMIKIVQKTSNYGGTARASLDDIWIPSYSEIVVGSGPLSGEIPFNYPLFVDNSTRIKNRMGVASEWATRSGLQTGAIGDSVYYVTPTGSITYMPYVEYNHYSKPYVPIGCCIGAAT